MLRNLNAHEEIADLVTGFPDYPWPDSVRTIAARSLFELARFEEAKAQTDACFRIEDTSIRPGEMDLLAGDEVAALHSFKSESLSQRRLGWPHQNLAARYGGSRNMNAIDVAAGNAGQLYDEYNYLGQRTMHVGGGYRSTELYTKAIGKQHELRKRFPRVSRELQSILDANGISIETLRILPGEWFSQAGHLALLEGLFRMRSLGWWSGDAVMVPHIGYIANHLLMTLYQSEGLLLLTGADITDAIHEELLSLQRYCGLSFNAFEDSKGTVVPWQDAGALLLQEWERQQRALPLREAFDARYPAGSSQVEAANIIRSSWGMKPGDWYVCLHLRDASHYGETSGSGQSHRNASTDHYIESVRHITSLGGWVIKLGGPNSPALPDDPQVVDYARGLHKSEFMDLWLIRNCTMFIGTTSGLTNVAISFGIPCALVNCITTDAQLWHSGVRFALKPVTVGGTRDLSQHEITSAPWRWRMFTAETLAHHRAVAAENADDEVLETVKEVYALATGASYEVPGQSAEDLIAAWKESLWLPYFYGASQPSLYYLAKYQDSFLATENPDDLGLPQVANLVADSVGAAG